MRVRLFQSALNDVTYALGQPISFQEAIARMKAKDPSVAISDFTAAHKAASRK